MKTTLKYLLWLCLFWSAFQASAQEYAAKLQALRNKGTEAMNQRNFALYLNLAHQEYNLTNQYKDTNGIILACITLTDYYTSTQKLNSDSADFYRNKGIYWARLKKDFEHEAEFKFMKAAQYYRNGNYVDAYALFQSLDSVVSVNDYKFTPFYNTAYGDLLVYLKEDKKALERTKMAAEGFKKQKYYQWESVAYMDIGGFYFKNNQNDSFYLYINKALKINQALKDTTAIAECYTRLGLVLFKEGRKKEAFKYYKLAFELNPKHPSDRLITNYTDFLIFEGKWREADELLTNLRKTENKNIELAAIKGLIGLRKKEGRYSDALDLSEEYNRRNQELLDVEKVKQIEELQTQYEVAEKESQINLLHERNEHQAKTLFQNRIIQLVSIGLLLMVLLIVFLIFRNKAISLKAELVLLERQLLRSQMNPHFIFNCLTNIQSTVLQKEYLKAAGYIATFAKLVRNILENSTQSKVTFSSEFTALKDYLILQKIRYNDSFGYEITVDEAIEEDMISIPPMLFQPIVENAIEHGIAGKNDGFINIHFQQYDKHVECTVVDNGVGYGNNTVAPESESKKRSLSTQITKRRMVILSKYLKQTLNYKIAVLHKENGEIAGTKVQIDIPILS